MTGDAGTTEVVDSRPLYDSAAKDANLHAWKLAGIASGLLFVWLVAAHWETAVALVKLWGTDSYGHGPFVVGASAYLIWRQRQTLFEAAPRPALSGPIALLLISAAWLLVHIMVVKAGRELLFVASISAIVLSACGWRALRLLAFPLAYLVLAISAWDVLLRPLQTITAILSTDLLQLLGLPVFREVHYIDVPNGQFLVEEACAGLRTFLAGMAVGALYAYISYRDFWRRAVFLGLTTLWALAINVLRVTITVGSSFPLGMPNFVIRHHGTLGWIIFGLGLIPLFAAGRWLTLGTRGAEDITKVRPKSLITLPSKARLSGVGVAAAIAIALAPALAAWYAQREADVRPSDLPTVIKIPAPWHVSAGAASDWKPVFHGTDGELRSTYTDNGKMVWLYTGYYAKERPGAKLIYFSNRLYDPVTWQSVRSRSLRVNVAGEGVPIREIQLSDRSGMHKRIIWYWYHVAGADTTSQIGAKLLRARTLFSDAGTAVIALASNVEGSPSSTRKALKEVVRGIYTKLATALDGGGRLTSANSTKP